MNILIIPQISMRSYEDGRYFLKRDAQINKSKGLLNEMAHRGHNIFFVVPTRDQIDCKSYGDIFASVEPDEENNKNAFGTACGPENRIRFLPVEHGKNVLVNRYMFRLERLKDVLQQLTEAGTKIDFCINEIVPITKALYTMQTVYLGYEFPVVSCMEHMTLVPENALNQKLDHFAVESVNLMVSELAIFPMSSMEDTFTATMKDFFRFSSEGYSEWMEKTRVWNHYFSSKEIDNFSPIQDVNLERDNIILFGSRLSDDKRTKYPLFFQIIRDLWEKRQDFSVIVANPNEGETWEWVEENLPKGCLNPFLINDGSDNERVRWLTALKFAKIFPVLYPMDELYSVGCQEALYSNCHLLTPKLRKHREGMPELDYEGYFDDYNEDTLMDKLETLLGLESDNKLKEISLLVSGENKANNVLKDIEDTITKGKKK